MIKEIEAFKPEGSDPVELLRFKAAVDRGIRLAAKFSEEIETTF